MTNRPLGTPAVFLLATMTGAVAINFYLIVTEVWIFHAATTAQISQWDWSNAVGPVAFQEGGKAVVLGIALHMLVSAVWAAVCLACMKGFRALAEHPVVWGFFFGIFVMCAMRYGVVPLGHAMKPHSSAIWMANLVCAHTIFFGIPVALVARSAART